MGRHSSKKKSNLNIKKVGIVIVIIAIIVAFVVNKSNAKSEPEKVINSTFESLKTMDIDKANKYINYNELIYSLDETLFEEDSDINIAVKKELFSNIEWKINKIEKKNNNINATVEMKNKDFIKVITNWIKKMVVEKNRGETITNELSLKILKETLEETKETKTETGKITLIKNNNEWKIEVDENLRNLMYPGIDNVANVINN